MHDTLSGVFAPIVTVFDDREEILSEEIAANISAYNQTNLAGYMPLGSNGEFQGLTEFEALTVLGIVCRERSAGKTVVAGCGRESVKKTLEFIEKAAGAGLDYAFILPPHYFAALLQEEGLFRYYVSVADKSPIPIVVYNAPKFASGVDITPALAARLSEHPNIAALKNSSKRCNSAYVEAAGGRMQILAGNIGNFYAGIREGAAGGVLSTASYLPEYCCRLFEAFARGDEETAARLDAQLKAISGQSAGAYGIAGVKLAMDIRGLSGGHVRLPLMDLPAEKQRQFIETFREYDIGPLRR